MDSALATKLEGFLGRIDALPKKNTPNMRRLRRELSKELREAGPKSVLDAAHFLIAHDLRWVGYELVHHHSAAMTSLRLRDVESLGDGMAAWDHVDTFACSISGPCWRDGHISDHAVRRWTRSPDRWWRRAAIVSTVPLNVKSQGGHGDVLRTLALCAELVDDHDDMIEKAQSWALRCLVPHDSEAVRGFLVRYSDELGARVKREVNNKLRTGVKNPKTSFGR